MRLVMAGNRGKKEGGTRAVRGNELETKALHRYENRRSSGSQGEGVCTLRLQLSLDDISASVVARNWGLSSKTSSSSSTSFT